MKILHIITGLADGGAEGVLCRLISADLSRENQHYVISLTDRGRHAAFLESLGSTVDCLHMPRGRLTLKGLRMLYRRIKAIDPDVVQTWMYHADLVGGVLARLAGYRAVVWGIRQSNIVQAGNSRLSFMVMKLCAHLSGYVPARIACCSEQAVGPHLDVGYRADKFTIIPNGYSLDRIRPDREARMRFRQGLSIDAQTVVLGMVARFDPLKDHENLFTALHLLKRKKQPFVCLLAGEGMTNANQALAAMVDAAGVGKHLRLIGPCEDVPAIMNALDIHVLSSASEGFPNVLAEAMACGTPCVSTDVGDAALILGGTGWLVPRQDPERLADAMSIAIHEYTRCQSDRLQRQAACRDRIVEYFDLQKMVCAYQLLWHNAMTTALTHHNER